MSNGSNNLILQPRDLLLLRALSELRILTRDQTAALSGFHSTTRVNVRLSKLRHARLIQRYFVAGATGSRCSVYALTRRGAQTVQLPFQPLKWSADSVVLGNAFAAHQLALNDVRIAMSESGQMLALWKTLDEPISPAAKLVPDALIERKIDDMWRSMFLEVDLGTETLPTWTMKTRHYLHFATGGDYRKIIQADRFGVLVATDSEARLRLLRTHIAKLTPKLFWFTTLNIIKQQGFWSPIWLRPEGDQQTPPGA